MYWHYTNYIFLIILRHTAYIYIYHNSGFNKLRCFLSKIPIHAKYKVYEVFSINGKYRINNAAKIPYTTARHNNPAYVETTLFLHFNFQHFVGNLAKIAMNRRHWCPLAVERRPWHSSTYERRRQRMLASERGEWRPY